MSKIIGERCRCGHLRSEHGDQILRIGDAIVRNPSHGNCCTLKCNCTCKQFRWIGFVYSSLVEVVGDVIRAE
jgi:hypothetical protein